MNKTIEFTEDDDTYLKRYHRGGLSLQEICQRLKRKPDLITERLFNLHLVSQDQLDKTKTKPSAQSNEFIPIIVILSVILFIFSLIIVYPRRFPNILVDGYLLNTIKILILLSIPVGFYEWGRSIKELFKSTPKPLQAAPREKWTLTNERLLKILADEGHSLKLISLRLGFATDERYTEGSVRSKLVQLNFYNRYLEKQYSENLRQINTLSIKLGKDFGNSVITEEEFPEDNLSALLRHCDEPRIELRKTFFSNSMTGSECKKVTLEAVQIIAGFINSMGGTLIIGASKTKLTMKTKVSGIFDDRYMGEEKYLQDLTQTLRGYFPIWSLKFISIGITKYLGSEEVCIIKIRASSKPVFCKYQANETDRTTQKFFFIRCGGKSIALAENTKWSYISDHFP